MTVVTNTSKTLSQPIMGWDFCELWEVLSVFCMWEECESLGRWPLRWFPMIFASSYFCSFVIPPPWIWAGPNDSLLINRMQGKVKDVTSERVTTKVTKPCSSSFACSFGGSWLWCDFPYAEASRQGTEGVFGQQVVRNWSLSPTVFEEFNPANKHVNLP